MDTLHRFSNRVENYINYRPDYPAEVISFLTAEGIVNSSSIIADIGSGTGISAELFLKNGNAVFGIEPNKEMREAGERLLQNYSLFKSISGTAEITTLPDQSVDLIVAGQAFHWFDQVKSKVEFERILKQNGWVVLMWNDRRTKSTQFLENYEDFIKMFATDYSEVNHKNLDAKIFNSFFGEGNYIEKSFPNFQYFDLEGLKGRVLSSSYMPSESHKDYDYMMYVLRKIFNRFQENGKVTIEYDTRIYYGKLKSKM
jgi:SAM-dependent methyltransferase